MNGKKAVPYGPKSPSTVVAGKKRIRNTLLYVWLSPDERAKIQERMADVGIRNLSAYVRKMAQMSVDRFGYLCYTVYW